MRLKSAHVRMFRNVVDSGLIELDNSVTSLVGKNESGKTAILEALYRLNPVDNASTFDESAHYPRWRLIKDRRAEIIEDSPAIEAVYEIEEADASAVEVVLGAKVLTGTELSLSVFYGETRKMSVSADAVAALKNLIADLGTPKSLVDALAVPSSALGNVPAAIEKLAPATATDTWKPEDVVALKDASTTRLNGANTEGRVAQLLAARLPKMFYFSDYQTLPGRINVTELAGNENPGQSGLQTARALLKLAYTDVDSLTDENFEERVAELEAVSNELTSKVFEYWKQNRELSIQIMADKESQQQSNGQFAVVRFLDVRVKDARHGFTNNFDQRSSGFKWFFSFLAAFSEFEDYEHGVVVLLDEPALTLHGKAQADFLRYIDDELSKSAQVVYTTHSPFMVDTARLERVRVVEDKGPTDGSVVSDEVLSVGEDSLFPLQAALGYDIAQNLFVGPDNLMVEGTSDFTYLIVLSEFLKSQGRTGLDERWRVLPAGGASNIPTFVALVGKALDVTVLIDGSTTSSVAKVSNLADKGYLAHKRILLTDQFSGVKSSDIEDLFNPADYLVLYNGAFSTSIVLTDVQGKDRIISRLSRHLGADFTDHGRPADYLLRNRDSALAKLKDKTLDNFEALFTSINATLT